jgi:nucleoside-triphosphatase THEP1
MSKKSIYILSGGIQTGKTTALIKWSVNKNDVFGILTPVIDGKRVFMDAHSKNQFEMEADGTDVEIISVGRFRFSKLAFEKAIQIINDSVNKKGWLVIDEIGPLELRKEGFYDVIKKSLEDHPNQLLFVVRENLVDKTIMFFELKQPEIINKEKLSLL